MISTNEKNDVSMSVSVSSFTELSTDGIFMAAAVLIGLYILIIFEMVHRTLAAMIGATVAIACLALIQDRPSLEKVMSWLDVETLCLLFGMMVLVAILCETGFFDYTAVLAFRLARGRMWPLITTLCIFTAVISAFLDNVTTILLMTPVTIRLCEVMSLDPKHVLIALVIFSNIGGAATPVGDPPNVIIISNEDVINAGVDFASFTVHVTPGIIVCMVATYIMLRIMYRDTATLRFKDPPEVVELRHEIEVWKKACKSLPGYSRDENTVRAILRKKVYSLESLLKKKLYDIRPSEESYQASLVELSKKYKIRNKTLLVKTGVVLACVIILFFLQSIPNLKLSLGWVAILGAITLLILADLDEIESVISRVEWSTLLFFAALFVVMEALAELQLLWYIGQLTQDWISSVNENQRLLVAILLVIWVSAIASSFIDNIPFTTVMIKIVVTLSTNKELNLPLTPLVYALAFGACLGGNGTLIGASANVVCAGVAEQHGYRFTFMDFFKIGFPVMLLTVAISTGYLLLCHVALDWNS
ncbi:P protein-like [Tachypleus tridentatus]|uniref:P protein-like n=1 Tax=Tachypleus tridentatus TaxID=6853 RepID=UPI003FD36075